MPYRAHGHRRGTVMRERIASLAPRTGDRCSFTHRDRGAVGRLGSAIPICASDTIGAAPCESRGTAGAGLSSQVS